MLDSLKFHHIAVATNNIEKSKYEYENIGFSFTDTIYDDKQNVNICFVSKQGHPLIELVEPVNKKSPVYEIIKKNGTMPYHFCYLVDDISEIIKQLKKQAFVLLQKPVAAKAFDLKNICFMYNKHIGLIELLEK